MADNLTSATIDVRANTRGLEKDILKALKTVEFSEINTKRSSQALGRITGQASEFNKSLEASNARVVAFGASAGAIFAVEKALASLISSTIEVEKKLTDINVLLNLSASQLEKFGGSLFDVARNTSQSFSTVADAAGELARQGLGIEETLKRTNAALILTRLSGMNAKDSVEALTSTLNSFSGTALDAVEVVNKLANVDAAFAVSSADLANAISRVGSTAQDAGVSLDELIALVTSAQQTTARGGSVIGNSFKTIFTRLERGKVQDLLKTLGIDTGEGQSAISLLSQLASIYDTLGAAQKSAVAEQVGGVFQINILRAALSDLGKEYSIYGQALETSLTSTDEAIRRNELLNKTVAALSSQTVTSLQQAADKIGSIVFAPNAKTALSGFNKILESFNNLDSESVGGKLMEGFFTGVGNFISGPGAVLATAVLVKLFAKLSQFASGSVRELLGRNEASKQQVALEQSVLAILQKNSQFTNQILSGKMTTVQAEKQLLEYLTAQSNILREQERLSKIIGANLGKAGVSIGASGIPMVAAAKGKKVAASGFVPNFASDQAIGQAMENAGAKQHGYKAGKAKKTTIHDGNGKSFKSFVNSREEVKTFTNADGKKATIVRPPNGFGENTQYAARGFVPNFAKKNEKRIASVFKSGSSLRGLYDVGPVFDMYDDSTLLQYQSLPKKYEEYRKEGRFIFEEARKIYTNSGNNIEKANLYLSKRIPGFSKKLNKKYFEKPFEEKTINPIVGALGESDFFYANPGFTKLEDYIGPDFKMGNTFAEVKVLAKQISDKKLLEKALRGAAYSSPKKTFKNEERDVISPNLIFASAIKESMSSGFIPNFATAKASDKMTEMVMQRFYGITDPKKFKEQYDIQSFKPAALKALYRERVGGGDTTLAGRAGLANEKASSGGGVPVKDLGKIEDYTMIHAGAEGYSKKIADYVRENKKTGEKTRYLASIGTAGLNSKQLRGGSVQDRVGDALVSEANNLAETFNPGGGSKFSNYSQLSNTGSVFSAAGTVFESAVRSAFNVPAQGQGDRIDFPNPSDKLRSFFHNAAGSYEAKITDNPQNRSSALSKYIAVKGLSSGFVPNFAPGIITGDVIRGNEYKAVLDYLAKTSKPVRTILGPSGVGKTTMGSKLGGKIAKSFSDLDSFDSYILDRASLDFPKDPLVTENLKNIFSKSSGAGTLDILLGSRSTIKSLRERRVASGDKIVPDRAQLPTGTGGVSSFVKGIRDFKSQYPGANVSRMSKRGDEYSLSKILSSGYIPNFAKSGLSFSQNKDEFGFTTLRALMDGKKVGEFEWEQSKKGVIDIGGINVNKSARGMGVASSLYKEAIRRNPGVKMRGELTPQIDRLIEKLKAGRTAGAETLYPQIKRADLAKDAIFEVFGSDVKGISKMNRVQFTEFVNNKINKLKNNPDALRSYFDDIEAVRGSGISASLETQHSAGFVPNFSNALNDAIAREQSSGLSKSQIYVDSHNSLKNKNNPMGLMVANTRDEPSGGIQGIKRAKKEGRNPKTYGAANGFIPNFAGESGGIDSSDAFAAAIVGLQSLAISFLFTSKEFKDAGLQIKESAQEVENFKKSIASVKKKNETLESKKNKIQEQIKTGDFKSKEVKSAESGLSVAKELAKQANTPEERKGAAALIREQRNEVQSAKNKQADAIKKSIASIDKEISANNVLIQEKERAIESQKKQISSQKIGRYTNMASSIGMAGQIIAPQISNLMPEENKGGRAAVEGLGTIAGFAGTGAMFGPWGAAIGAAVGATVALTDYIDATTTKIPDLKKAAERASENFNNFSESGQSALNLSEKYAELRNSTDPKAATELVKIQEQYNESLLKLTDAQRNSLVSAIAQGKGQEEYNKISKQLADEQKNQANALALGAFAEGKGDKKSIAGIGKDLSIQIVSGLSNDDLSAIQGYVKEAIGRGANSNEVMIGVIESAINSQSISQEGKDNLKEILPEIQKLKSNKGFSEESKSFQKNFSKKAEYKTSGQSEADAKSIEDNNNKKNAAMRKERELLDKNNQILMRLSSSLDDASTKMQVAVNSFIDNLKFKNEFEQKRGEFKSSFLEQAGAGRAGKSEKLSTDIRAIRGAGVEERATNVAESGKSIADEFMSVIQGLEFDNKAGLQGEELKKAQQDFEFQKKQMQGGVLQAQSKFYESGGNTEEFKKDLGVINKQLEKNITGPEFDKLQRVTEKGFSQFAQNQKKQLQNEQQQMTLLAQGNAYQAAMSKLTQVQNFGGGASTKDILEGTAEAFNVNRETRSSMEIFGQSYKDDRNISKNKKGEYVFQKSPGKWEKPSKQISSDIIQNAKSINDIIGAPVMDTGSKKISAATQTVADTIQENIKELMAGFGYEEDTKNKTFKPSFGQKKNADAERILEQINSFIPEDQKGKVRAADVIAKTKVNKELGIPETVKGSMVEKQLESYAKAAFKLPQGATEQEKLNMQELKKAYESVSPEKAIPTLQLAQATAQTGLLTDINNSILEQPRNLASEISKSIEAAISSQKVAAKELTIEGIEGKKTELTTESKDLEEKINKTKEEIEKTENESNITPKSQKILKSLSDRRYNLDSMSEAAMTMSPQDYINKRGTETGMTKFNAANEYEALSQYSKSKGAKDKIAEKNKELADLTNKKSIVDKQINEQDSKLKIEQGALENIKNTAPVAQPAQGDQALPVAPPLAQPIAQATERVNKEKELQDFKKAEMNSFMEKYTKRDEAGNITFNPRANSGFESSDEQDAFNKELAALRKKQSTYTLETVGGISSPASGAMPASVAPAAGIQGVSAAPSAVSTDVKTQQEQNKVETNTQENTNQIISNILQVVQKIATDFEQKAAGTQPGQTTGGGGGSSNAGGISVSAPVSFSINTNNETGAPQTKDSAEKIKTDLASFLSSPEFIDRVTSIAKQAIGEKQPPKQLS